MSLTSFALRDIAHPAMWRPHVYATLDILCSANANAYKLSVAGSPALIKSVFWRQFKYIQIVEKILIIGR